MFEPAERLEPEREEVERIYRHAPRGALAVAGVAVALVFGLWLVFYLLVFLPRGMLQ